jgi:predicted glutamine amidotransferase
MCRMVGVVFRREFPMGILDDLCRLSEIGTIPGEEEKGHRDGWGLVSFRGGSPWYIGRSARPLFMDSSFDAAVQEAVRLTVPNILIAHARAASSGAASLVNTHPFVVNGLVVAHNGTIKNYNPITRAKPKGETDSERLALVLADRYEETGNVESAIEAVVRNDIQKHEFSAAILLVSDGNVLCGYRDYSDENKSGYYDLNISVCKDHVALYQETLTGYGDEVSEVKKGELVTIDMHLGIARKMLL